VNPPHLPTDLPAEPHPELDRFVAVMERLRVECPWDAQQTHRSLVTFLVEETGETIEAIESGDDVHLREELGDLLLQVIFHTTIATERGAFTLEDVATAVADKLIARHPYVFASEQVPDDLTGSWEARKATEKGRTSALEGIPEQLSALSRASKIISRARSRQVPVELPDAPVTADQVGRELVVLTARAQAHGIDAEQAARDEVRQLEARVRAAEAGGSEGAVGDQPDASPGVPG